MFNMDDKNKGFKTIYDYANNLAVRCKTILDEGTLTNYLINIKDSSGLITILLDKNGNPMFSQVRL